jgi:hypothetical protein
MRHSSLLLLPVLAACSSCGDGDDGTTPPPSNLGLEVTVEVPNPTTAPLVRRLRVEASEPVSLTASWSSGDHEASVAFPEAAAPVDHLLLGWRAGRSYVLTVTATGASGATESVDLAVTTDPAPAHFPRAEVIPGVGTPQEGQTLVPMHTFLAPEPPAADIVTVWDEQGELVWWLDAQGFVSDAYEYDGGLLVLAGNPGRLFQYSWDGTEQRVWSVQPSEATSTVTVLDSPLAEHFHHDVQAVPEAPGRFVGLGRYAENVPDYPADYDNAALTAPRVVAVDVMVEFDEAGHVVHEVALDEVFPTWRIGYDSLDSTFEGYADWAHANAIFRDGEDWIVSLRHQDVILKLDPAARQVEWILGHPDNWPTEYLPLLLEPVGPVAWPWHTHGPSLLPEPGPAGEKRLVVYDNGNYQAAPYTGVPELPLDDPANESRVVQFSID